jgi:hypothetical protein
VYHIQEGTEYPTAKETKIMQEIFDNRIVKNKNLHSLYETASADFRNNVRNKNSSRIR